MRKVITRYRKMWKSFMLYMLLGTLVGSILSPYEALASGTRAVPGDEKALFQQLGSGKRADQESAYVIPEEPTVYLTFDDGPSGLTPQVLDILKKEEVKATFFVLGEQAEANPETMKRIVREGHALGNHSYDHVYQELYKDFESFWKQVLRTEEVVYGLTGERMRLLRAPGGTYGNFDPFYFYYLNEAGYSVYDWSIDSEDSRAPRRTAAQLVKTVTGSPLRHEVNVLLHDGSGHQPSVQALPDIIAYFKKKGYRFAPLSAKVKPVQLAGGPVKWERGVSLQSFEAQTRAMRAHKEAWTGETEESLLPLQALALAKADEPGRKGPQKLAVQIGSVRKDYAAGTFLFRNERFQMPVRQIAEAIGAEVQWSEDTRTASVRYGARAVEYDLARLQLRIHQPVAAWRDLDQAVRTVSLPDMELREGSIYVPLRSLLELLGIRIESYDPETPEQPARVTAFDPRTLSLDAVTTAWRLHARRAKV
ncbi:polysaccharide deacetylase [Paenibacillus filicis]|uniref:Polysaccharide deacetylase n=1 Tax=Paenibacillus filicis TaxID=669464 RepID=A0ABU9DY65_9BACL